MDHREAVQLLPLRGTEELTERRSAELEAHLRGCAECREWAATHDLLLDALAGPETRHPSSEQLARRAVEPELLTPPERRSIDEHLQACADCRQELAASEAAVAAGRARGRLAVLAFPWRVATVPTPVRWAAAAVLILAVTLAFVLRSPRANREIVGAHLGGVQVLEARQTINVEAVVVDDGEITLRAGERVTMSEGFSVGRDATLKVEVPPPPASSTGG